MGSVIHGPILLTGAGGLIGRAMLAQPDQSRRIYPLVREPPAKPLPDHAVTVVHDLRRHEDPALPEPPETVIHLAQSPHYRDFPDRADDVFEVNIGSTQRLLDWAHRNGVRRFVYASTGGLYGRGKDPVQEGSPLRGGGSLGYYLVSKQCGELLAQAYAGRMIVIVLRLFFVYGPGQRRTMLIPRLIEDVAKGRPIPLQGQNGIRINPIYVADAAAAIWSAAALRTGDTINVAGPQSLTIREIATLAGRHLGRLPRFEMQADGEAGDLIASISKMTALLGEPKVAMNVGMQWMIASDDSQSGGSAPG